MLDGIISALASYERVEQRREEKPEVNSHIHSHELEITVSPHVAQLLTGIMMEDGRPLLDHLIDGRNFYRDLSSIGRV